MDIDDIDNATAVELLDDDTILQSMDGMTEEEARGWLGKIVGGVFGGPIGAIAGNYIEDKIRQKFGKKSEEDEKKNKQEEEERKRKEEQKRKELENESIGGGCSKSTQGVDDPQSSDQNEDKPYPPRMSLEIEDNSEIPQNWWDKLPDFDPRVYDAIAMEQAAACVKYVFEGLPDIHELEHQMASRAFRNICPRLKTQVPRSKIKTPKEIIYDTTIDTFIDEEATY